MLALVAIAEREQQRVGNLVTRATMVVTVSVCNFIFIIYVSISAGMVALWGIPVLLSMALPIVVVQYKAIVKHKKATAEVGETIREVVSASDWQSKLDPLDWAHLRTRINNLELFDLSSVR